MVSRQVRLTKFCLRSIQQSTMIDCWVSYFQNTKVLIPFYPLIMASNIILIFLIREIISIHLEPLYYMYDVLANLLNSFPPSYPHSYIYKHECSPLALPINTLFLDYGLITLIYLQRYNSFFLTMLKFRRLKDHIVNSKRNSQLLHQQELFNLLQEQCSLSRINISLNAKLQAEINQITPQDYKIYHQQFYQSKQVQERSGRSRSKKTQHLATEAFSEHKFNRAQYSQDYLQTAKKGHLTRSLIEGSNFTKIIDLMKEVNDLQRRKIQSPKESQSIKQQIRRKLAEVKFLICTIEDDSQKSLIDFYNQDCGQNYSPESFHSHNSDQTYQVQSERQAYQFSATKEQQLSIPNEQEGQIQIKYRRISPNSMEDISIYDTLDDQSETVECNAFQQRQSEKSINHLFSYEKEKTLDSPLPSISQRSSQYCSPSSKHSSHNQSLQFKKIYYLLQTSVKKEKANGHRLVSEFTPSKKQQKKKSLKINEQKDWDSCQQQLYQTINLLQTKYKRKVNVGVENIMDSLNMAIKQKNICLRTKK